MSIDVCLCVCVVGREYFWMCVLHVCVCVYMFVYRSFATMKDRYVCLVCVYVYVVNQVQMFIV